MSEVITEQTTTEVAANSEQLIKNHVLAAMGFGIVPIPGVDMAGVAGTQLAMLSKLCKLHGIQFSDKLGKSVIGSLLGAVGTNVLATGAIGSVVKAIPLVGSLLGGITYSGFAGASTYAVGKVFDRHFLQGGDLVNFKPSDVKDYFKQELETGKEIVKGLMGKNKK